MRFATFAALSALAVSSAVAHADCADEFAQANKAKVEAGPYRMVMHNQVTNELDGKTYAGKPTVQTYEFAPPDAIHLSDKSPLGDTEAIYIGKEGWTKGDGGWKPAPPSEMTALIEGGLYGTYFNAARLTGLICHGLSVNGGMKVRSYSYATPIEDVVPRALATTAYFSAETGLPLAAVVETTVLKSFHRSEIAIEFDRSIRIERPQ